jgi:hypothetical protein
MASVQILYWKDIPVQVRARDGRERASLPMPERFQVAVDQAAMAAGITGSDAYTDLFVWQEGDERPGSAQEAAAAAIAELDARFDTIDWKKTAAALSHE